MSDTQQFLYQSAASWAMTQSHSQLVQLAVESSARMQLDLDAAQLYIRELQTEHFQISNMVNQLTQQLSVAQEDVQTLLDANRRMEDDLMWQEQKQAELKLQKLDLETQLQDKQDELEVLRYTVDSEDHAAKFTYINMQFNNTYADRLTKRMVEYLLEFAPLGYKKEIDKVLIGTLLCGDVFDDVPEVAENRTDMAGLDILEIIRAYYLEEWLGQIGDRRTFCNEILMYTSKVEPTRSVFIQYTESCWMISVERT